MTQNDHREQNSSCPVTWEDEPRAGYTGTVEAPAAPKVKALVDLLKEARSDLASYVCAEYPENSRNAYPSVERSYHRDMELCRRIDAALAALEGGDA